MASAATMRWLLRGESELGSGPQIETDMTLPRSSSRHGRRITCFRPLQRYTVHCRPTNDIDHVCACAHEPLPCHFLPHDANTDAFTTRRLKWHDKFDSQDWGAHVRGICQKWRDNQTKVTRRRNSITNSTDSDDSEQHKTSPTRAVQQALTSLASVVHSSKWDSLLRTGVPPSKRGYVWWLCSGAADKHNAATSAESYGSLLRQLPMLSKRAVLEIEKDLPRTFPITDNHPISSYEQELGISNTNELRRVLQAYCLRNPTVGYCQSMNFLAAVLLQYLEEEEAFWVLVAMVEELIPQFHARSMVGSRAEQRVFTEFVQLKLPLVADHIQRLGVDLEPFTLKWFLCLFLNTLPLEPAMRVWDVFFCEGSHVLLRVGLTLLKLCQPRILACDDPIDVYEMFKFSYETLHELTAPYRTGLLNRDECVCDTLIRLAMDKSFLGLIPFDALHELRLLYRNEVMAELKAADERRALHRAAAPTSNAHDEEEDEDEEDEETFHQRHAEAERELQEYDFVEEYAYHCGDVSPIKHIHFGEIRGGSISSLAPESREEVYVEVDYTGGDSRRSH